MDIAKRRKSVGMMSVTIRTEQSSLWEAGSQRYRSIVFYLCQLDGKGHLKFFQTINDKTAGEGPWAFVDSQAIGRWLRHWQTSLSSDAESAQWSGRSIRRKRVMVM